MTESVPRFLNLAMLGVCCLILLAAASTAFIIRFVSFAVWSASFDQCPDGNDCEDAKAAMLVSLAAVPLPLHLSAVAMLSCRQMFNTLRGVA